MCQTVAAGMQQQHDGDLGAIVRSAGACGSNPGSSSSTSQEFLDNLTAAFAAAAASSSPNSSSSGAATGAPTKQALISSPSDTLMGAGSFMELISGGSAASSGLSSLVLPPIPDLSNFPQNSAAVAATNPLFDSSSSKAAAAAAHHVVKREAFEATDYDHIFSHSRSLSFLDDQGLFGSPSPTSAGAGTMNHHHHRLNVKSELSSLDLGAAGSFDCGSPASPAAVKVESSADQTNTNNNNTGGGGKHQGSKRSRKMQQKRIVCVPVAGGGKPTGEVLPSDMWAWRKYGQKPIKGSPYPRGYYRCSSSKGCSARKQVERCRNDPTMLIITYTSEHNHPWPAHRNSLAGTTRIRPMTAANASSAGASASSADDLQLKSSMDLSMMPQQQQQQQQLPVDDRNLNPFPSIINSDSPMQIDHHQHHPHQQHMHQERDQRFPATLLHHRHHHPDHVLADIGFDTTSRSSSQDDDFFSELEELPELSSILDKGFLEYKSDDEGGEGGGGRSGGGGNGNGGGDQGGGNGGGGGVGGRAVDPFNLFNWSSPDSSRRRQDQQQQQQQQQDQKEHRQGPS